VALSEAEMPAGDHSVEMTGLLGLLAYAHLGLSLGWIPPTPSPQHSAVSVLEMSTRELQDSPHPFARIGQQLDPGRRQAFLLTNNAHYVPIILAHPGDPLVRLSTASPVPPPAELTRLPSPAPANCPRPPNTVGRPSASPRSSPLPRLDLSELNPQVAAALSNSGSHLLMFDGGCLANGGPRPTAGAGFVVYNPQLEVVVQGAAWLAPPPGTVNTNNVAEFTAFVLGVQAVLDLGPTSSNTKPKVVAVGDSQLVIHHLQGRCAVTAAGLLPLAKAATAVAKSVDGAYFWTPRAGNGRADALATEALARRSSYAWKGDDWAQASRDWAQHGRAQPVSVAQPLRLLHGVLHPPASHRPAQPQPAGGPAPRPDHPNRYLPLPC